MRVGTGYDVHQLGPGRPLILGGVKIPHPRGLLGHSDADVLVHAICDALLGAISEGDIGVHFPNSDPQYRDIDSLLLLRKVTELAKNKGFGVVNIDATIVAQTPKLTPYLSQMKQRIAETLGVEKERVNIKATTTERLGFIGREEGIAAYAIVLLESR
ncbi:MAG: 2-C-methyl-D-erythritol 2,4-cyclodiphosphate synthase [Deltaproteobacteria bacterium]|nr:MAG: 2-C-methyl-D-erythritol 2,4-cyclodiphosphate synthase [Deltaproteobacteria bacterium]